jgi:hypothetical protein
MTPNRRRTARCACDLATIWKRGRTPVIGAIRDVSIDGMFLATEAKVPVNQVMDLSIELPTGTVSLLAVSRQCSKTRHGSGIGLTIFAMEPNERKLWVDYYRGVMAEAQRPPDFDDDDPTKPGHF